MAQLHQKDRACSPTSRWRATSSRARSTHQASMGQARILSFPCSKRWGTVPRHPSSSSPKTRRPTTRTAL
ncbi:hypothetical protein NKH18_19480 [Streptomyces sp. M10(2022)]